MGLLIKNTELEARIKELELQVKEHKLPLGTKSNNSSKPLSSDGFRKPKSQRTSGGKIVGKPGYAGTTSRMVQT
jgi:transposase